MKNESGGAAGSGMLWILERDEKIRGGATRCGTEEEEEEEEDTTWSCSGWWQPVVFYTFLSRPSSVFPHVDVISGFGETTARRRRRGMMFCRQNSTLAARKTSEVSR